MGKLGGMSGPFSRVASAECARCKARVEATWPWGGWHALRRFWFGMIALILCLSPIFMADVHGMLPAVLVIVVAIGPLNALAQIKPTCLTCGGPVSAKSE